MKTSQKLILAFCKTIMVFSASIFVISTILLTAVLRPEPIKDWVANSGLYTATATELRSQVQQNFSGSAASSPIVARALERTITPEQIQVTAEKGIEGSFAWLDGDASEPQFELNEQEIRTTLANEIVTSLRNRANRLPACSLQNPPRTTDIFTINCLPPGTDIEQQLSEIRAEITTSTEVNPSQTDASVTEQGTANQNSASSQDIVSQLQAYRQSYQWLKLAPILATILFIVSGVVTFIIIKPKYRILRTLSLVLIPQALLYIIAGWLTPRAVQSSSDAILGQTANTPFAESIQNITLAVTNTISSNFTRAGMIIGAVGLVLLVAYVLVNKKFKPEAPQPEKTQETSNSESSSS